MMRTIIGFTAAFYCALSSAQGWRPYGNVSVELTQEGELRIHGDGAAFSQCALLVRDDGNTIVHAVSPTTVNGSHDNFVVPTCKVTSIEVVLGGGDDWFRFGCWDTLPANLSIDTGAGHDEVWVEGDFRDATTRNWAASICGNVGVDTGRDSDVVLVRGLVVLGKTVLSTGHGSDLVGIGSYNVDDGDTAAAIPCEFGDGLVVDTGLNDDELFWSISTFQGNSGDLLAASVDGDLEIQFGQGNDVLRWYDTPTGTPFVDVSGNALLVGGQGEDLGESLSQIRVEGTYEVFGFEEW